MLDFAQKRKLRGLAYHRVTLVFLGIIVIFFARATWSAMGKERDSRELRDIAQSQTSELSARNGELSEHLLRLETPQGVEAEIRSKFNVAKVSENVVVILEEEATSTVATPPTSLWQRFLHFLGR